MPSYTSNFKAKLLPETKTILEVKFSENSRKLESLNQKMGFDEKQHEEEEIQKSKYIHYISFLFYNRLY